MGFERAQQVFFLSIFSKREPFVLEVHFCEYSRDVPGQLELRSTGETASTNYLLQHIFIHSPCELSIGLASMMIIRQRLRGIESAFAEVVRGGNPTLCVSL
jgi:hypothetical protein